MWITGGILLAVLIWKILFRGNALNNVRKQGDMMKIVIAPKIHFKESLSVINTVRLLKRDFQPYFTMRACLVHRSPTMAEKEPWTQWWLRPRRETGFCRVGGPMGKSKKRIYGLTGAAAKLAIIEMAAAGGLMLSGARGVIRCWHPVSAPAGA